eukprot:GHVN01087490.1.p1 GENE.GHVN01087490.1~~GHVN01087490.1.p1  ORF type:complete len:878 (-),score=67.44 GHVN01087490.1:4564-7197(-)
MSDSLILTKNLLLSLYTKNAQRKSLIEKDQLETKIHALLRKKKEDVALSHKNMPALLSEEHDLDEEVSSIISLSVSQDDIASLKQILEIFSLFKTEQKAMHLAALSISTVETASAKSALLLQSALETTQCPELYPCIERALEKIPHEAAKIIAAKSSLFCFQPDEQENIFLFLAEAYENGFLQSFYLENMVFPLSLTLKRLSSMVQRYQKDSSFRLIFPETILVQNTKEENNASALEMFPSFIADVLSIKAKAEIMDDLTFLLMECIALVERIALASSTFSVFIELIELGNTKVIAKALEALQRVLPKHTLPAEEAKTLFGLLMKIEALEKHPNNIICDLLKLLAAKNTSELFQDTLLSYIGNKSFIDILSCFPMSDIHFSSLEKSLSMDLFSITVSLADIMGHSLFSSSLHRIVSTQCDLIEHIVRFFEYTRPKKMSLKLIEVINTFEREMGNRLIRLAPTNLFKGLIRLKSENIISQIIGRFLEGEKKMDQDLLELVLEVCLEEKFYSNGLDRLLIRENIANKEMAIRYLVLTSSDFTYEALNIFFDTKKALFIPHLASLAKKILIERKQPSFLLLKKIFKAYAVLLGTIYPEIVYMLCNLGNDDLLRAFGANAVPSIFYPAIKKTKADTFSILKMLGAAVEAESDPIPALEICSALLTPTTAVEISSTLSKCRPSKKLIRRLVDIFPPNGGKEANFVLTETVQNLLRAAEGIKPPSRLFLRLLSSLCSNNPHQRTLQTLQVVIPLTEKETINEKYTETLSLLFALLLEVPCHVIPCIVSLATVCCDSVRWSALCLLITESLRKPGLEQRKAVLDLLGDLYTHIGPGFAITLPEVIPAISEMIEDQDGGLEESLCAAIEAIEKTIGKSLEKYLMV